MEIKHFNTTEKNKGQNGNLMNGYVLFRRASHFYSIHLKQCNEVDKSNLNRIHFVSMDIVRDIRCMCKSIDPVARRGYAIYTFLVDYRLVHLVRSFCLYNSMVQID